MKGKFIVIEGVDGSGKTMLVNELSRKLHNNGKRVAVINNIGETEVSSTILSRCIREKINTNEVSNTLEMVYLYLAGLAAQTNGVNSIHRSVNELLEEYDYVICSRWIYSTMVYGISLSNDKLEDNIVNKLINTTYDYITKPDLVLVLDVELDTIISRLSKRDVEVDYFSTSEKLRLYHDRYNNLKTYITNHFPIAKDEWSLTDNKFKYIDNNDDANSAIWLAYRAVEGLSNDTDV